MPHPPKEEPALRGYFKNWSYGELLFGLTVPPLLLFGSACLLVFSMAASGDKRTDPPLTAADILISLGVLGVLTALLLGLAYGVNRRARWAFKGLLVCDALLVVVGPALIVLYALRLSAGAPWPPVVLLIIMGLQLLSTADQALALYRALRDVGWPPPRQVDPLDKW